MDTMGHMLAAFISQSAALRALAAACGHTQIIALPHGFFLLPIQVELLDHDHFQLPNPLPTEYPAFRLLVPELIVIAGQHAQAAPIAYVETDYHGGVGTQAAMLWYRDTIIGPVQTETRPMLGRRDMVPAEQRAINQILHHLGVQPTTRNDCFDTLGLGRFRSNEAWMAYAAAQPS
jgi:hypothetical protein